MKTVSLGEYLSSHGTQSDLAKALGIQQSAVSQMHRSNRNITITLLDDGSILANEIRPIPSQIRRLAPPRTERHRRQLEPT